MESSFCISISLSLLFKSAAIYQRSSRFWLQILHTKLGLSGPKNEKNFNDVKRRCVVSGVHRATDSNDLAAQNLLQAEEAIAFTSASYAVKVCWTIVSTKSNNLAFNFPFFPYRDKLIG